MSDLLLKELKNEDATIQFGSQLSERLIADREKGCVVYLHGELGAGKTTLVRGVLQGLGYTGRVKSPTYTLVEQYEVLGRTLFHFDLYRLADPEELEYLGIRDYLDAKSLVFVEWPERGKGFLSNADIDITLTYDGDARRIECKSLTPTGQFCLPLR